MFSFKLLHDAITQHGTSAFSFINKNGNEHLITWQDLKLDYLKLANHLKHIGLPENPVIAIMSGTRYEWTVADFAIQSVEGITVGLYKNDRDSVLLDNLKQSQPHLLIIENYDDLKRLQRLDPDWGWDKPVLIMDAEFQSTPPIYHLNAILAKPLSSEQQTLLEQSIKQQPSDRVASYIFTSGTGGTPKATVLTMGNLLNSATVYEAHYDVDTSDSTILYLPFSHVFARVMFYASVLWGQQHHYVSNIEQLPDELKRISPSVFLAVPRLLEKVKKAIEQQVSQKGLLAHLIYKISLKVGKLKFVNKDPSLIASLFYPLANKLILGKLRDAFGTKIRFMGAGGGKLNQSIAEYFWSLGIPVYEGYASTESGGLGIFNYPNSVELGSIGSAIDSVAYKISDDGELLLNSPSNAQGYLINGKVDYLPEWLHTGDIVRMDSSGFIAVVDRKKDIMVSSYGKNIAPSWIEEQFMNSPLIADIVVCGDDRPFVSALIVPAHNALVKNEETLLESEIARINQKLSRHERIKSHLVVSEFEIGNATMTATFKKRRAEILKLYRSEIDQMYQTDSQLSIKPAQ